MKHSMTEYNHFKQSFFDIHPLKSVETSPMDEYGIYRKTYLTVDNHVMIEINSPIFQDVEFTAKVNGVEITKTEKVKFFQSELFSDLNPQSEYFIEMW